MDELLQQRKQLLAVLLRHEIILTARPSIQTDAKLRRVLHILYKQWFMHDSLQPRAMWIVEFPAGEPDQEGWFLQVTPNAKRAYFAQHIGLTEKSLCDWQRFHALWHEQPWNQSEFKHRPPFIREGHRIYEVGFCWFSYAEDGRLSVAMTFGPLYGRGYLFDTSGHVIDSWVS